MAVHLYREYFEGNIRSVFRQKLPSYSPGPGQSVLSALVMVNMWSAAVCVGAGVGG